MQSYIKKSNIAILGLRFLWEQINQNNFKVKSLNDPCSNLFNQETF